MTLNPKNNTDLPVKGSDIIASLTFIFQGFKIILSYNAGLLDAA
jgi:hypothetical protein